MTPRLLLLLAALCAVLAVAFIVPAAVDAAPSKPLPVLPDAYSAVVVANIASGNFTLAYKEEWDALSDPAHPRLKTQGRFAPSNSFELLDFRANTSLVWSATNETAASSCTKTNITKLWTDNGAFLGPSKWFFDSQAATHITSRVCHGAERSGISLSAPRHGLRVSLEFC